MYDQIRVKGLAQASQQLVHQAKETFTYVWLHESVNPALVLATNYVALRVLRQRCERGAPAD